jgi:hemoglobin
MKNELGQTFIPPGGPPKGPPPDPCIYQTLGEAGVRELLSAHYRNLAQSEIGSMFPLQEMELSAQRSADFFIQVLGGPPYYTQKKGPPQMRRRHLPFRITNRSRGIWLDCFRMALDELNLPQECRGSFETFLDQFSAWMVNAIDKRSE